MKEIKVDKIEFKSKPARVDVTGLSSQTRQYQTIYERNLELTVTGDDGINGKLNVLENGDNVLVVSDKLCVLLRNYILENYSFLTTTEGFKSETDINIIVREKPIVAEDKNEIIKDMI